jgi:hypothetical protein
MAKRERGKRQRREPFQIVGLPSVVREETLLITSPVHDLALNVILLRRPPPLFNLLTKDMSRYSSPLTTLTPEAREGPLKPEKISLHSWHW